MQLKRVLHIQDGMQPNERYAQASARLDAEFSVATSRMIDVAAPDADLVIVSWALVMQEGASRIEQAFLDHEGVGLLLVVEPAQLSDMALPKLAHVDFVLSTAEDDELVARMRHLLSVGECQTSSDQLAFDNMVINFSTYQVLVKGEPVDFTYLEYALLAFLITHAGHVYSRDALLSQVWGFDYFGGSRTVDVHVRRVRSKLGNDLAAHLRTVRGVGYIWE